MPIPQSLPVHAAVANGVFAAPTPNTAAVPAIGIGGAFETMLALAAVLLTIFALAWLLRRLKSLPGSKQALLRNEAQLVLGDKERIVLLAMGPRRWLLGVTAGGITVLQALEPEPTEAQDRLVTDPHNAGGEMHSNFAAVLRRSLGLKS